MSAGEKVEKTITLVVPLYNEEDRFEESVDPLAGFILSMPTGSEIVFVDDGSTDETTARVEKFLKNNSNLPGRLIRSEHRGKGAALAIGLSSANTETAGFCDIDLATPLSDLKTIFRTAQKSQALVIGSRDLAGSEVVRRETLLRQSLGRAYNRLVQLVLAPGVVDTQCGAKAASTKTWKQLLEISRESGFAWDVEMVALAKALHFAVEEVPISWYHDDRSRVRVIRDGTNMVLAIPRIWRRARRVRRGAHMTQSGTRIVGHDISMIRRQDGIFDAANAEALMDADVSHWWLRSKAAFVSWALRRWGIRSGWLVDLGAGSGGVTALLGWPRDRLLIVEGSQDLMNQARRRHSLMGMVGDIRRVPLPDETVQNVCLLDVIEHAEQPTQILSEASRILKPGGRLIVTVPAHQWLWSSADESLGHYRRYNKKELIGVLTDSRFRVISITHIFSWLVPFVWASRRLPGSAEKKRGLGKSSSVLDVVALVLTRMEHAINTRLSLPFGTSILCVAEKTDRYPTSVT